MPTSASQEYRKEALSLLGAEENESTNFHDGSTAPAVYREVEWIYLEVGGTKVSSNNRLVAEVMRLRLGGRRSIDLSPVVFAGSLAREWRVSGGLRFYFYIFTRACGA